MDPNKLDEWMAARLDREQSANSAANSRCPNPGCPRAWHGLPFGACEGSWAHEFGTRDAAA
ncbi:hypothetical protein ACWDYH_14380 [Nocardia goodfellowii]|uniref:Uncharacterized protein n=1 Tax=Nocardia goodfellowii TaxID=882446 RepID=A0ABS4QQX2_9NOCA|nr:hypothetical protein [Nocardia goodfellowii]MBP2194103.1 hypothetical protein [Nocardia goodfellowii]